MGADAPLWNVAVTTPSCIGCNVLSADPFTNPPSEAGIHALTVSGLTPAPAPAPPPIIVVPVDPAPAIDASTLVTSQLAALQRLEKAVASEASSGELCEDHSEAVTSDSESIRPTQTACKQPNRLVMPAETEQAGEACIEKPLTPASDTNADPPADVIIGSIGSYAPGRWKMRMR